MHNDIPEARRQSAPSSKRPSPKLSPRFLLMILVGLVGIFGVGWLILGRGANTVSEVESPAEAIASNPNGNSDLLGHLPYEVVDSSFLDSLVSAPSIQLHYSAATSFDAMVDAARDDGVYLVALSGFRSRADQEYLFFKVKEDRNQGAAKRAEVSAPPGHSEHHTGFAVDIGDEDYPDSHVEVSFEKTPAFEWLERNAARFSFELSFPEGNDQGVSYEPWHWRFVGDQESLEVFYKGR